MGDLARGLSNLSALEKENPKELTPWRGAWKRLKLNGESNAIL